MRIRLNFFFLPPYAPQYNPDELLNNALKQNIHRKILSDSQADLKARVLSHMHSIQKRPQFVKSFFNADSVQYAR